MSQEVAGERLTTWAAIGAYIGRDARTAKRYEAERRMPVHRMPGGGKSTVYAFRPELDAWLRRSGEQNTDPAAEATSSAPPAGAPSPFELVFTAVRSRSGRGIAGAVGFAAVLAAAALRFGPSAPVRADTSVVVAALQNDTGDGVFDRLVPRLLQVDLTQSPRLQVAGEARVAQALALMERPRDAAFTPALAREVCARGNGGVIIAPGAARLGDRYVLTAVATDCVSGRILFDGREIVAAKGEVPQAVDRLAARTRRKLGESQTSVLRLALPLLPARTASFEALRAYSEAMWLSDRGKDVEAVSLFRRAIEQDGGLGLAWLGLAQTYFHARQWREDADAMGRAYALRGSMSERDGLFTAYRYHLVVEKDFVAALGSLKALAMIYAQDATVLCNLSFLQFDLGEYADAIASARQALQADPRSTAARFNLMRALTRSGHASEARSLGEQAARDGLVDSRVYEQLILAAIELGDSGEARRLLDAAVGTQFERDALLQYTSIFGDGRARAFDAVVDRADALGIRQGVRMDWPAVAGGLADLGSADRARYRLAMVDPDLRVAKYHRASPRR